MTIAGSDSGGGAGIQADLKTILMHDDCWGICVITAITAQNTQKVKKIFRLPLDIIENQFDTLIEDFDVHAIKTGMLLNSEIIDLISSKINLLQTPLIIDPVMRSTTGTNLSEGDFLESLIGKLIPISTIITPNINEAEILSNISINNHDNVEDACRIIKKLGTKAVLIKGGHLNEKKSDVFDTFYYKEKFYYFKKKRITGNFHGIGCTFSTAIACNLAKDIDIVESVKNSETFIEKVILSSKRFSRGLIPVNQKIQ